MEVTRGSQEVTRGPQEASMGHMEAVAKIGQFGPMGSHLKSYGGLLDERSLGAPMGHVEAVIGHLGTKGGQLGP